MAVVVDAAGKVSWEPAAGAAAVFALAGAKRNEVSLKPA
jgi:hypothetical protein